MRGRFGNFDDTSSITGNIALLEKLKKEKELHYYVPGHGISGKRNEVIDPFLTYMKVVMKWAKKAYDDDLEAFEVKDKAVAELKAFHDWDAFDHRVGQHLAKAYNEIMMQDDE